MNYSQITQDTIHILRTNKLVWLFGFLSLLMTVTRPLSQFADDKLLFAFIYILVSLVIMYFSLIAVGSFIYVIHQNILGRNLDFSGVWSHSKTKALTIIGVSFPAVALALLVSTILKYVLPNLSFQWLVEFMASSFISSFLVFSVCAVMINDVKAASAIWTGFLIAVNNFFRVLMIAGIAYLIRISITSLIIMILRLFGYTSTQKLLGIPVALTAVWILYIVIIIPSSVFLTLAYLKFTKEVSYSALSNQKNAA